MSDTPRTDVAQHNMGSIVEPHYVVDADFSRYLERELVAEKEWVRQSTNSNARLEKFLAEAQAEVVRLKGEIDELRAALAEPAIKDSLIAQRPWVGLAGTEINHIFAANVGYPERMMKEVETLLKDKNT
jgi:hypothetical protein